MNVRTRTFMSMVRVANVRGKNCSVSGKIIPFRPNRFNHYFYALTVEKQQIYKLTSRHRVLVELVDLLFLSTLEAMEGADRTLLMSINQVIFIQVTDAKMRGSVISVYKYFPL